MQLELHEKKNVVSDFLMNDKRAFFIPVIIESNKSLQNFKNQFEFEDLAVSSNEVTKKFRNFVRRILMLKF